MPASIILSVSLRRFGVPVLLGSSPAARGVVRKGEPEQETDSARDWTEQEVRLIVADYFAMLVAELQGEPYKKSKHRKALIPLLARHGSSITGLMLHRGLS